MIQSCGCAPQLCVLDGRAYDEIAGGGPEALDLACLLQNNSGRALLVAGRGFEGARHSPTMSVLVAMQVRGSSPLSSPQGWHAPPTRARARNGHIPGSLPGRRHAKTGMIAAQQRRNAATGSPQLPPLLPATLGPSHSGAAVLANGLMVSARLSGRCLPCWRPRPGTQGAPLVVHPQTSPEMYMPMLRAIDIRPHGFACRTGGFCCRTSASRAAARPSCRGRSRHSGCWRGRCPLRTAHARPTSAPPCPYPSW